MRCPNEFILSQFADGELSKTELLELDSHLIACRACRDLVAGLKAENRLLVDVLQGIDLQEPVLESTQHKRPEFSGIDRLAIASISLVILLRIGLGFIEDSELPSVLQWLHPWSLSGLLNWMVNGLFYIIEEGGAFMTSLVEAAGFAILGLLIVGCTIALARRAMRTKAILGLISLLFVFIVPSYAIEVRKAEKGAGGDVSVGANETINDTLVVFADSVSINGTVTGDLIAFARNIDIQGTVQGNVLGFAQRIEATGNVEGDIVGFGQTLHVDGQVKKDLWAFGQTVSVGKSARLDNNATLFANSAYINGDVGRDVSVYATTLDVSSRVGRDLGFRGAGLIVHSPSAIGRDLDSKTKSEKGTKIDAGVTIGGKKNIAFQESEPNKYRQFGFYARQALRIGSMFIMGLLLYWMIPGMRRTSLFSVRAILTSGGIGFLTAVAAPIAGIILAITLIGIPVTLLLIALWLLGLYLAKIVVAERIGNVILGARANGLSSTLLPLLVGLIIVIIAVNLPYIGGILNFLLILIGLGAIVMTLYRARPAGAPQD